MGLSLTYLRNHLYRIVDEILAKGIPVEITRKGKKLKIVPVKQKDIFAAQPKYPVALIGEADDIQDIHWDTEWEEEENL